MMNLNVVKNFIKALVMAEALASLKRMASRIVNKNWLPAFVLGNEPMHSAMACSNGSPPPMQEWGVEELVWFYHNLAGVTGITELHHIRFHTCQKKCFRTQLFLFIDTKMSRPWVFMCHL